MVYAFELPSNRANSFFMKVPEAGKDLVHDGSPPSARAHYSTLNYPFGLEHRNDTGEHVFWPQARAAALRQTPIEQPQTLLLGVFVVVERVLEVVSVED